MDQSKRITMILIFMPFEGESITEKGCYLLYNKDDKSFEYWDIRNPQADDLPMHYSKYTHWIRLGEHNK